MSINTNDAHGFFESFQAQARALQGQVEAAAGQSTSDGAAAASRLSTGLSGLISTYRDMAESLPAHDQKTCSDTITRLSSSITSLKASTTARAKFTFKKKPTVSAAAAAPSAAESTSSTNPSATTPLAPAIDHTPYPPLSNDTPPTAVHYPLFPPGPIRVSNHGSITLSLPAATPTLNTSITLLNLTNTLIILSPSTVPLPPSVLTARSIRSSLLIIGRVAGAVHLTDLHDTIVVVSARQVRLHASHDVVLYMRCASQPVVEDCVGVRVAPLAEGLWVGDALHDDGLVVANQWAEVRDFSAVGKQEEKHWSVLEPERRVARELWGEVLGCENGAERVALLQRVGITGAK